MTVTEHVHPPALSLPSWPLEPEPVDRSGTSFLVIAVGASQCAHIARAWAQQAEAIAPTILAVYESLEPDDRSDLVRVLGRCRTGVRIMVVGGQYDVLTALALARSAGAIGDELRSFVTHEHDLPIYCAHCRDTYRVEGSPGDDAQCPGCLRILEIHPHMSAVRGSFLASDAHARELP